MTYEVVYVPQLAELHWYGCEIIRRHDTLPPDRVILQVKISEITCAVCRPVMGSPPWA